MDSDEARWQRAVEIVRQLLAGAVTDEAEDDRLLHELEQLVPDPNVSELIYWPTRHPLSRDLARDDLTAEEIVELAFRYKPFAL